MTSGSGARTLAGHGCIHHPGHRAVISDNGQDGLFYHYYADSGASHLRINLLGWDSAGWPFVYRPGPEGSMFTGPQPRRATVRRTWPAIITSA
jgi:hypothetical protein